MSSQNDDHEDELLRSVALRNAEIIRMARQRAERDAEATLLEQANLLNLTHDSIFVRGMNGAVRYWNRAAEELYGWTAEEALGKVAHRLLTTIFPATAREIEAEVMRAGRWEGELVHTKKDGSQVVVASRWSLQRDEKGAPVAILETNNDITERKRAQQARQEIEELWRAAFESNPTMYFIVDATGTTLSVNAFGAEQLGYTVGDLVGQPVLNVFCESDRLAVEQHTKACFEHPGRMARWEARKIRKDGTMLCVRETANAVMLKNRLVLLVVCEDITERKQAERERERLRQLEADLAHINRVTTVGELTASLAHEVNQPITAAVTNANTCVRWLGGEPPKIEEAREAANRTVNAAKRAAEIIDRIRSLFKKSPPQRELLDLNKLILEMIALLRTEATRQGVSLLTALAPDLPQVAADRVQLQQVLMNLMANAIQAMKGIEGSRELTLMSRREGLEQVVVSVADTGVGLPPEGNQIFSPFFTKRPDGTGMGLTISRSIVESHGGRLWATDNSDRGATFHFLLPKRS